MRVIELINKSYSYEAKYQRDSAWLRNTKNLLIDSVINDYFIPQILIANNEVVDGKQRLLTLKSFYNNDFKWTNSHSQIKIQKSYWELTPEEKLKFDNKEIDVKNLGDDLSDLEVLETFIRINEGSIKLSKVEKIMAKATPRNRNLVKDIVKKSRIKELTSKKKNDSRFKLENLIIRSLTILSLLNPFNTSTKKDVRSQMEPFMKKCDVDIDGTILYNSIATIELMYKVLGPDIVPNKVFNTVFESIFCSFYSHLRFESVILLNKLEIKHKINEKIEEIINDQMGGGIKFDSLDFIKKRINKIDLILDEYHLDSKRSYTYNQKEELWRLKEHICELCNKKIDTIDSFEIDHHKPHSLGGRTTIENARILCRSCNNSEGQKTKQEIRKMKLINQ